MLRDLAAQEVWFGLLVVAAVSLADYHLSVVGLRWFKRGASEHYDLGGSYELNPPFQADVDAERLISPRHLFAVVRMLVVLFGCWWFTARLGRLVWLYEGLLGFLVLTIVPALVRHVQNIAVFRSVALRGGVEGKTTIPRWMDLKVSGVVFWAWAGVYLLMWSLSGMPLFVGGAVGTSLAGARFWIFGTEQHPSRDP